MRLTLAEIAEAVSGEIVLPDGEPSDLLAHIPDDLASDTTTLTANPATELTANLADNLAADGVSTDSRTLRSGQLFVPLVADHDGHDYIRAAVEAGASACLSSREPEEAAVPIVVVPDTASALTDLARVARRRLKKTASVIGITGSVGKTTTKDFCAAALATTLNCWASEKSYNNEIGLPLTLLNAPENCEVLVAEMGASRPGDIASLCQIARPHYGILTAIAIAHTESFGTIDQIAHTKAELLEALPAEGVAIINRDDERVMAQAERVLKHWPASPPARDSERSNRDGEQQVGNGKPGDQLASEDFGTQEAEGNLARQTSAPELLTFGLHPDADVRAENVSTDEQLHAKYLLRSPWGSEHVRLGIAGLHNVGNSLAAAAVALHLGVPVEAVAESLSEAEISPWRMSLSTSPSGVLVLNDSYNANPTSMEAALQALAQLQARRHLAVLGTMAELGEYHNPEHRRIADLTRELGVEAIAVAEPAYGLELVPDSASALAALGSLGGDLAGNLGEGDAVLVKGSRVAELEFLADRLLEI